jgi:hypothetical protein
MIFEKFQNNLGSQNESLDSAYSGDSLNIIGNSSNLDLGGNAVAEAAAENTGGNTPVSDDFHQHIELEDAKFDFNIWDLLGVSKLSKDKRNCMLDCGIKSFNSLENCSKGPTSIYEVFDGKNKQKCKMKSYKDALKCAKNCHNLDNSVEYVTPKNLLVNNNNNNKNNSMNVTTSAMPTTSIPTTQSLQTTQAIDQIQELKINDYNVHGVYADVNNLAPFEAKYWPGLNKYGWNTNSIDEYNQNLSDKVIEVRAKEFQDFDIAKPYIEFNTHNNESKSKQFYPYATDEPNLQFGNTGLDMMMHEVEGFQNRNNREGFQNRNNREGFQNRNNNVIVEDKVFKVGQLVLDRKCPHNGCKLHYNKDSKEFQCPCHHSRFNMRGDCISGPACNSNPSNLRI